MNYSNYPMYNNSQYYVQNLQDMRDKIDNQIRNYQQNQNQQPMPQPTNLTQNFQLAPNPINNELESKYVNNIDDVKNTFVMKTGVFVDKDFSTLWVKDVSGNVRTFRTEEIIEMDDKDKEIIELKRQINEMKGMLANANEYTNTNVDDTITEAKSSRVSNGKRGNAK